MSLADDVAAAIADAKEEVSDLLVTVLHTPLAGRTASGPTRGSAVARQALLTLGVQRLRLADGTEQVSIARLTFLEGVIVTPDDRFTLPDGRVGKVLQTSGFARPGPNGVPYITDVTLG